MLLESLSERIHIGKVDGGNFDTAGQIGRWLGASDNDDVGAIAEELLQRKNDRCFFIKNTKRLIVATGTPITLSPITTTFLYVDIISKSIGDCVGPNTLIITYIEGDHAFRRQCL